MQNSIEKDSYKEAGVDIEAGNQLVNEIKPLIRQTNRAGVMGQFGGFGSFFDPKAAGYKDPIFVSGTDGVGTKLKIAIETQTYNSVGIDLVAMCVNDLLVQGAEPLFFLDYFATGKLEVNMAKDVISGIVEGCKIAGCALIGGETAEMPNMYQNGDFDLAGFSVGAVERDQMITGDSISEGDIVLGLASDGVHSNGFSLVRKLLESAQGISYTSPLPFDQDRSFGEAFLTPTRIYVQPILKILKEIGGIHGMSHITGGGLTENIPRIMPDHLCADIRLDNWDRPPIFSWLQSSGNLLEKEMLRTFNCGIGYVLVVNPERKKSIQDSLEKSGEKVFEIGNVKRNKTQKIIFSR